MKQRCPERLLAAILLCCVAEGFGAPQDEKGAKEPKDFIKDNKSVAPDAASIA